ncbi:UDP-glucose dehydrogenase family protein [Aquibacillus sediminis]|uniref:UDP-glucose dehydrogenase family protein n=1 Tax=Aquibacillus sediminis TaxID=2574734 RepID=UPI001107E162|nr:UDP-glucose/GDP-mannose dehydrogenase family protein [Aquibacillus sediminis]
MNISIIGAGYVGLTTTAFLSSIGHNVFCVDKDIKKINRLNEGEIPIYEPGLEELFKENRKRLSFTTNFKKAISQSSVIFITVGTPSNEDGSTNLSYVHSVIDELAACITTYKTIIVKSTVPPGTNEQLAKSLIEQGGAQHLFTIVSNPEFLREGSAVDDMFHPDRTVIGLEQGDTTPLDLLKKVYKGYEDTFVVTNLTGAEMIKYASNAFLATKISYINELARICDAYDVDINQVAKGMGLDPRIGGHFLQAGIGYGGSCFPKDVASLYHVANTKHVQTPMLEATQTVNQTQVDFFIEKINMLLPEPSSTTISVLGIAFKPNTDDIRYSKALSLIDQLAKLGYTIKTFDPKASLPHSIPRVTQVASTEQAINGTDAIIVATDWDEFKHFDWQSIKQVINGNVIFDARNCLDPFEINQAGLDYVGIGRGGRHHDG